MYCDQCNLFSSLSVIKQICPGFSTLTAIILNFLVTQLQKIKIRIQLKLSLKNHHYLLI